MATNAIATTQAAARAYAVLATSMRAGEPKADPSGVRSWTCTGSALTPTTRASTSTLTLRPGSMVMSVSGSDSKRIDGKARSVTPTVTVRSSWFSMVTGTRPVSPEKVTVPSERTRTRPTCSSSCVRTVDNNRRPVCGSLRHALDSVRNRAEAKASEMPRGLSRTLVKVANSSLASFTSAR